MFALLADPEHYIATDWDLTADPAGRRYWVSHFIEMWPALVQLIRDEYAPTDAELETFRKPYHAELEALLAAGTGAKDTETLRRGDAEKEDEQAGPASASLPASPRPRVPASSTATSILSLDDIRDRHLRAAGWPDPYRHVKAAENAAALKFYPQVIAELDSRDADRRLAELIEGVFAGNIFDLGALATVRQYHEKGLDFFATRATLAKRPWLVDDFDALHAAWRADAWAYRKVIFLVDNAGCDFVLGCLPLIREMAAARPRGRGAEVVIGCNTGASLNDILKPEAEAVVTAARVIDPLLDEALSAGRIRLIETGNRAPLFDLANASEELNAEADGADLLILEGQGRSVESNVDAKFAVDTARLALLKDPEVARRLGGRLFDIACRFTKKWTRSTF
ncbi:MAG: hypothetical protein BIFFINMI_03423 [Phycisphaerae bacterium]|nr:hypothetical protein [Phycisphaerae bacterium]